MTELTTSKTGKHGHAKANITALDIFTGKKYMDISPTSHNMSAPFVAASEWQILTIDEDEQTCDLMNEEGETKEGLPFPCSSEDADAPLTKHAKKLQELWEAEMEKDEPEPIKVRLVEAMDIQGVFFIGSVE